MAWKKQDNAYQSVMEEVFNLLTLNGLDDLKTPMEHLLNEAMRVEREAHLHAAPWQRSTERAGYANGYKPKTVLSRFGKLDLQVP